MASDWMAAVPGFKNIVETSMDFNWEISEHSMMQHGILDLGHHWFR